MAVLCRVKEVLRASRHENTKMCRVSIRFYFSRHKKQKICRLTDYISTTRHILVLLFLSYNGHIIH